MTDDEYRQEHQFDSMLLWRCEYDLNGEFDICTWVSYMWSTRQPSARDMQYHWDKINPQGYIVENFSACAVPPKDDSELQPHIIMMVPKEVS